MERGLSAGPAAGAPRVAAGVGHDGGSAGGSGGASAPTIGGLALVEAADRDALAERLAADVAERLHRAIEARGEASLVVSGGSTPAPMFARLARAELDWSRVALTLADERWVPPDHPDSNAALVRRTLLVERAAAARFVPLYPEGGDAAGGSGAEGGAADAAAPGADALAEVGRALAAVPRPFTVVVLGMGADGHTASLFPDAPELERGMTEREAPVVLMRPPSVPQARVTLTRAALLDAEAMLLHVTGTDKRDVLERALADEPRLAPVARVLGEAPSGVTVYWSP